MEGNSGSNKKVQKSDNTQTKPLMDLKRCHSCRKIKIILINLKIQGVKMENHCFFCHGKFCKNTSL